MYCSSCGKMISDGVRFCPECGSSQAATGGVAVAPPMPQAPPIQSPYSRIPNDQGQQPYFAPPPSPYGPPSGQHGTRDQQTGGNLIYPPNPPLSPHLAWITLLIVGLPQLLYGQVGKGIVLFLVFWLSFVTVIGPMVVLVLAFIDAYMVGSALKAGKPISRWASFPTAS